MDNENTELSASTLATHTVLILVLMDNENTFRKYAEPRKISLNPCFNG